MRFIVQPGNHSIDNSLSTRELSRLKNILLLELSLTSEDLAFLIERLGILDNEIQSAIVALLRHYAVESLPILESRLANSGCTDCERSLLQRVKLALTSVPSCDTPELVGNEANDLEWSPVMLNLAVDTHPLTVARAKFERDLSGLLTHSSNKWIAYSKDGRLPISPDLDPSVVFDACLAAGYSDDGFLVCHIRVPDFSGIDLVTCD